VKNITFNYLQEEKTKVMAHPPYSPDLARLDFYLFNRLKRNLNTYTDDTSLAKIITQEFNSIPMHDYPNTFQKWIERMKLCIEHHAEYFEHLL